jgi:hypothetical protein
VRLAHLERNIGFHHFEPERAGLPDGRQPRTMVIQSKLFADAFETVGDFPSLLRRVVRHDYIPCG